MSKIFIVNFKLFSSLALIHIVISRYVQLNTYTYRSDCSGGFEGFAIALDRCIRTSQVLPPVNVTCTEPGVPAGCVMPKPSARPTLSPTSFRPTFSPTLSPTEIPTREPNFRGDPPTPNPSSDSPTPLPSKRPPPPSPKPTPPPTLAPITKPTARPTAVPTTLDFLYVKYTNYTVIKRMPNSDGTYYNMSYIYINRTFYSTMGAKDRKCYSKIRSEFYFSYPEDGSCQKFNGAYGSTKGSIVHQPSYTELGTQYKVYVSSADCVAGNEDKLLGISFKNECERGNAESRFGRCFQDGRIYYNEFANGQCKGVAYNSFNVSFTSSCLDGAVQTDFAYGYRAVSCYSIYYNTPTMAPFTPPPPAACFAGEEAITMADGRKMNLHDIKVGDKILGLSIKNQQYVTSTIIAVPHPNNRRISEFVQIKTESGGHVRVTPEHLIPVIKRGERLTSLASCLDDEKWGLLSANRIDIGDFILSQRQVDGSSDKCYSFSAFEFDQKLGSNKSFCWERVTNSSRSLGQGFFTVVPLDDVYLIVGGIAASPFAISHTAASIIYFPLRATVSLAHYFTDISRSSWLASDFLKLMVSLANNLIEFYSY